MNDTHTCENNFVCGGNNTFKSTENYAMQQVNTYFVSGKKLSSVDSPHVFQRMQSERTTNDLQISKWRTKCERVGWTVSAFHLGSSFVVLERNNTTKSNTRRMHSSRMRIDRDSGHLGGGGGGMHPSCSVGGGGVASRG